MRLPKLGPFASLLPLLLAACSTAVTRPPTVAQVTPAPVAASPAQTSGIGAQDALRELLEGNQRFLQGGMDAHAWQNERVIKTGTFGQSPSVGVLSCADSRVPPEIVFDQGVGDLFVVRVAGNFESDEATGTFEYGVAELGVHTIVVLGHTKCGAIDATLSGKSLPGHMNVLTAGIRPALAGLAAGASGTDLAEASSANVRWQMKRLLQRSAILRKAQAEGRLKVLSAMYDVDTGRVTFLD
ncbi:MAG: hypothetical protein RL698_602 [Pseudomonadota bacterium]|jgi:carbonic anhydrase